VEGVGLLFLLLLLLLDPITGVPLVPLDHLIGRGREVRGVGKRVVRPWGGRARGEEKAAARLPRARLTVASNERRPLVRVRKPFRELRQVLGPFELLVEYF